jgi:CRP-like cAMP-binding protein
MLSRSGAERILAFLGRDAIVGELSIIDRLPRSASVVAVRDTALHLLSQATFEAFAEKHPLLIGNTRHCIEYFLTAIVSVTSVTDCAREYRDLNLF